MHRGGHVRTSQLPLTPTNTSAKHIMSSHRSLTALTVAVGTLVACAAAVPSAPRSVIADQPTLSGEWAGPGDPPFWYSATLTRAGDLVTGTGARGPRPGSGMMFPSARAEYRGTYRPPRVELAITAGNGSALHFVGELESSTTMRGVLTDANGRAQAMVLRRQ
ncbi:MAG: hypothetical protein NVS4B3_25220 [Gemmatimonadaceae bacterium]